MIHYNRKYLMPLLTSIATIGAVFTTNSARAYSGFDNRSYWEKAVSEYTIITEDFNSVVGSVSSDTQLPSTLFTEIPLTVNNGQAESEWAAFDFVFPDEVIAFGFDMISPNYSPNRDAILGNVKFFDEDNNLVNHLGVQFTSYDEDFVGFFLGENSGVHRIEYLWCGVWQGEGKPLDYCRHDSAQQTIDNFSFVTPNTESKSVPESDANFALLALAILGTGNLIKRKYIH
ncbi:hypothetical protein PN466_17315 [Roseofilum reptotaenium CS-1145]|uniref:PEP-CTERM sorting domain-containing protein n=1 Tax=Roseofilum reptotaenium AO1-A TaxID=1925591 RepID=A0A1L9QV21_9CYAN|nr:hypothetical protein [Roseofilum reptotaenium]MDB9518708.1 hypothetical protein [Roseofilum reptotaenium CS-1145]OJJ26504.1 hypothetical protein BI308_05255 [Roseofilum reptotaenium AO1-A]